MCRLCLVYSPLQPKNRMQDPVIGLIALFVSSRVFTISTTTAVPTTALPKPLLVRVWLVGISQSISSGINMKKKGQDCIFLLGDKQRRGPMVDILGPAAARSS